MSHCTYIPQCIQRSDCLCLCYFLKEQKLYLEAAYFAELGYELSICTPYLYYVHQLGLLSIKVGPSGSAPYVYFSQNQIEVPQSRHDCTGKGSYAHPNPHHMPFNYIEWQPAPYKSHFQNTLLTFQEPLVIIHNKHTIEWGHAPVLFIDISTLLELIRLLSPSYTVVYIWPDEGSSHGYPGDDSTISNFEDHAAVRQRHPEAAAVFFKDLLQQHSAYSFKELQLMLHARCSRYASGSDSLTSL